MNNRTLDMFRNACSSRNYMLEIISNGVVYRYKPFENIAIGFDIELKILVLYTSDDRAIRTNRKSIRDFEYIKEAMGLLNKDIVINPVTIGRLFSIPS